MFEFARNMVRQYKPFIVHYQEHALQPDQTLVDIVGSKEEYETNTNEKGDHLDLPNYIGSIIDVFDWPNGRREAVDEKKALPSSSGF